MNQIPKKNFQIQIITNDRGLFDKIKVVANAIGDVDCANNLDLGESNCIGFIIDSSKAEYLELASKIRENTYTKMIPIVIAYKIVPDVIELVKVKNIKFAEVLIEQVQEVLLPTRIQFMIDLHIRYQMMKSKEAEAIISVENEKSLLLENSLDAVIGVNSDQKIVYWNRHAEKIFGWTLVEVQGQPMVNLIIPERFREHHNRGMQHFLITGEKKIQNKRIEVPAIRKNGEEFPTELTVTSIKLSDGTYRFYSFIRDITESTQAKIALENQRENFRSLFEESKELGNKLSFEQHQLATIFDKSPAAMALRTGPNFIFEKVNPVYQAIFPGRPLVGKPFLEALPEFHGQPFMAILAEVFKTGMPFTGFEMLARHSRYLNGPLEDIYYDLTYVRINDPDGKPYGVYEHSIDVTDRVLNRKKLEINEKQLMTALHESVLAKEEAEKANELKTSFLANMSHEIRTPLGAMLGFAELLRDTNIPETEKLSYIDTICRNGESLAVVINDILDLSKVEAGYLALEYTDTNVEIILADVVSLLKVKALEKDLEIDYSIDDTTPENIISDPYRIRQVLLNVIGNSIKFTQSGRIKIRAYGELSNGLNTVFFEVSDTGIGISGLQKEKLFENFVQADGSMTRKFGGTGLGLALSRRLSRALKGELTLLSSQPNQGSTFLFVIPDLRDEQIQNSPKVSSILNSETLLLPEGVKVLVVDDSADNRHLIKHYLSKYRCIVDFAENGLAGFNKAIKNPYDIVLMDIQMPEMDGYTATRKLRSNGFNKPIIALTAHAMSEIKQKCLNVGCSDHLAKPINLKELIATIAKHVE